MDNMVKAALRRLILSGRENGSLSNHEIFDGIYGLVFYPEIMERFYQMLRKHGIEIIEDEIEDVSWEDLLADEDFLSTEESVVDNPVKGYLDDISKIESLTPEEERELLSRIADGDESAKTRLGEAHLQLVVSIAKRYLGQGLCMIDLIQEGNLGLVRAIEKYDDGKGVRFYTYAAWWIHRMISRAIEDQGKPFCAFGSHILEKVNTVKLQFIEKFGTAPTPEQIQEIIAAGGVIPERIPEKNPEKMPDTDTSEASEDAGESD